MKKNIISKVIFIILIIVLILAIILSVFLNKKDKKMTINMYNQICNLENYAFSMTEEDLNIDYTLTISRKGKTISIDTLSNEEHTTTLMEDEVAYYILHSKKEYYLYDNDEIDADILKEELFEINEKDYTYGYEKINGKSYYYEEYEGITAFIMWLDYNEEESVIKTRFYFDGTNIAYIKTTIDNDEELLKIEFSDGIDNSLFEIPSDYAEI